MAFPYSRTQNISATTDGQCRAQFPPSILIPISLLRYDSKDNHKTKIRYFQLNFCINLQRSSSSVKIELWVATYSTVLLFLFSPLFGTIQTQIALKLFLFLLQMLTLQLFSNRIAAHMG